MSATQPVAARPARGGGEPAGGRRNPGRARAVNANPQLMVVLDATIVNVALPLPPREHPGTRRRMR